ncbi:hypothetical protein ACQI4F_05825 [Mycolicibacterium vaccae]|uniref:hypothetical protein n=1 Tax=Mycolicibacterium vaccae TaxID=1810 RepID=UPI003CF6ACCC
MSLQSAMDLGYRFYREPPLKNVDCEALRPINLHARYLHDLLDLATLNPGFMFDQEQAAGDWNRIKQWLRMAAGLRFVEVEPHDDDSSYMCGPAHDYAYAHNYLACLYATEETRLIYAWSAVEQLLGSIAVPRYPGIDDKHIYDRGAALLSESFPLPTLPPHYLYVYSHLMDHLANDKERRADRRLRAATKLRDSRTQAGILLTAGNAMRNFPAHGDVDVPEPQDWAGAGSTRVEVLPSELHAHRLATRGLLLSLQMLLALTCDFTSSAHSDVHYVVPWLHESCDHLPLIFSVPLSTLLLRAHIEPVRENEIEDSFFTEWCN